MFCEKGCSRGIKSDPYPCGDCSEAQAGVFEVALECGLGPKDIEVHISPDGLLAAFFNLARKKVALEIGKKGKIIWTG